MTAPNQLSFLPEDYLLRKQQRRTNVICALLFIVVMAAIGSAFVLTERSMRAVQQRHADVQREYADAAKRIQQVKQMQDQQRKMARQAELTSSLLEKVPRSNLLHRITNALPGGVSLLDLHLDSKKRQSPAAAADAGKTAFEQKKAAAEASAAKKKSKDADGPPPPEPKLYDVSIKLSGIASNDGQVSDFIKELSKLDLLRDVNLVVVEEAKIADETVRKFQLEMMIDRDADLQLESAKKPQQTAVVDVGAKQ